MMYINFPILCFQQASLPEWIQACAAVFAAVGLVWTLYLQTKATRAQVEATKEQSIINSDQLELNKQQKELNRLLMERDRRDIRPRFKVVIDRSGNRTFLYFRVLNATAYEVTIKESDDNPYQMNPNEMTYYEWDIDSVNSFEISGHQEQDPNDDEHGIVVLIINYQDEASRNYTQTVTYNEFSAWTNVPTLEE